MRRLGRLITWVLATAILTTACDEPLQPPQESNPRLDVAGPTAETDIEGAVLNYSDLTTVSAEGSVSADTRPGVVLPAALATRLGTSNNTHPLYWPVSSMWPSMRYQQVFLGSEVGTNRLFSELCLRVSYVSTTGQRRVTLKLGTTDRDHTTIGTVYDENYSSSPLTVFSGVVTIDPITGGGINDFSPCFPFSDIYLHQSANLIVELAVEPEGEWHWGYWDACDGHHEDGCTTSRLYNFHAQSTAGWVTWNYGLVMKLIQASAEDALQALMDEVTDLELNRGLQQALSTTLGRVMANLSDNPQQAVQDLRVFILQVEGMRHSPFLDSEADRLIAYAEAIIDAINAGV